MVFLSQREQVTVSAFHALRRTIGERGGANNSESAFVPAVIDGEAQHEEPLVLAPVSGLKLQFPTAVPAERVAELVRALQSRVDS